MPSGYSVLEYQGDGVTTVFAVNFTLGYLNKSDIYCRVGDEVDGAGQPAYRELEALPGDPGRMRVLGAVPTAAQKVLFRRITSKTALQNDYTDGESLDDTALDDSFKQQLMITHELLDGFGLSTVYSDIDLTGHRIVNVVTDPNEPTSLCNVEYAGQAPVYSAAAQAAQAAAEVALSASIAARDAAVQAAQDAEEAAASIPSGTPLLAANNGSDIVDKAAFRANAGLAIGTDVLAPAGNGSQLIGITASQISGLSTTDQVAQDIAVRNALRLGTLASDQSGPIPRGYLYLFASDELETKAGATYDSAGDYYGNSAAAIPGTTGTTTTTGTLQSPANIFDDNDATSSTTLSGAITSITAGKDYGAGTGEQVSKVTVYTHAYAGFVNGYTPQVTLALRASNVSYGDSGSTLLGSITFADADGLYTVYSNDSTTVYRYIWVEISQNGTASGMGLNSVTFYGPSTNMTLIPTAVTVGASPTHMAVYVLHKAVVAATLNTDIKLRVTLNGTSWSAHGTLVDLGWYNAEYKLLRAGFDTSALSGTTLKFELTTLNNKAQHVRAVGLLAL